MKAFPDVWMLSFLQPISVFMGDYTSNNIDSSWFHNDGVVNTISQSGPTISSSDTIVSVPPSSLPELHAGEFNYFGVQDGWDHLALVGFDIEYTIGTLYLPIANILNGLPPNVIPKDTWQDETEIHVNSSLSGQSTLNCATGIAMYNKMCTYPNHLSNTTACMALDNNLSNCFSSSSIVLKLSLGVLILSLYLVVVNN